MKSEYERKIDDCVEKYRDIVTEICQIKNKREQYIADVKMLRAKRSQEKDESLRESMLKELAEKQYEIRHSEYELSKLNASLPRGIFRVNVNVLLGVMELKLKKKYPKETPKIILDKVNSIKCEKNDLAYDFVNYTNTYKLGYSVAGKEYVLPNITISSMHDYSASDIVSNIGYEFDLLKDNLIGDKKGCFQTEDWQDVFWIIVKKHLMDKIESLKRKKDMAQKAIQDSYNKNVDELLK